jgi:DNA-binding transcriptional LysR family regulator
VQDLNDLAYFAQVVDHGGFAAAGRAMGLPKSKLSRRVAQLEGRLGVRLIERSSRRFRVTAIGAAYHEQCRAALDAAARAEQIVEASLTEPRGTVRFSCPTGLVEAIMPIVPDFLRLYPRVRLQLIATDRPVDLIGDRIDVALRVRVKIDSEASLTLRTLGRSRRILVASPTFANVVNDIAALATVPTIASSDEGEELSWTLRGPDGRTETMIHVPRFGCADFAAVRDAAIAGLGVALLPDHACAAALAAGSLVRPFPEWHAEEGIVHLVFTTNKGLAPVVRRWVDHLAAHFKRGTVAIP